MGHEATRAEEAMNQVHACPIAEQSWQPVGRTRPLFSIYCEDYRQKERDALPEEGSRRHGLKFVSDCADLKRMKWISRPPTFQVISNQRSGQMMQHPRSPRVDVRIPLRIRALNSGIAPSLLTESLNVSATGLLFSTNAPVENGTPVEVLFRMPEEIVGRPANDWRCMGQVVRIAERQTTELRFEVGVKFHCYEVLGPPQ
jgi:hypothetical protein